MSNQNISNSSLEVQAGLRIDRGIETRQLCSRQDHVAHGQYTGSTGNQIYWLAAFDGHGKDQAINRIRNADLDEIMKKPTPWVDLQNIIQADTVDAETKTRSGSTMICAKVHLYSTYVEVVITNIGDSTGVVFLNDEPVFVTTPQNYENGAEMVRLIKGDRVNTTFPLIAKGNNFDVISPTTVRSIQGTYVVFESPYGRQELSMTQSLGHNGITGLKPDTTAFRFSLTDKIKIVLCSDGVSDIMPVDGLVSNSTFPFMTSTTDLLNEAERRWKQEWKLHAGTDLRKIRSTFFPKNGYDDCCCAMFSIQPDIVPDAVPLSVFTSCVEVIDESAQPKTDEQQENDLYA